MDEPMPMEEPVKAEITPALNGLPDNVLDVITQDFDVKMILKLLKTCKHLRSYITRVKLPILFSKLSINVEIKKITVNYENSLEKLEIVYRKHENGCVVEFDEDKKLLENDDYVDVFLYDFGLILESQSVTLTDFTLNQESDGITYLDENEFPKILQNIQNILSNREIPLQTINYTQGVKNQEHVMYILPYLASGVLKTLNFLEPANSYFDNPLELDEIIKTEQWKMAEEISCYRKIKAENVEHFKEFKRIGYLILDLNPDIDERLAKGLKEIQKTFMKSPNLEFIHLEYPPKKGIILLDSYGVSHMQTLYSKGVPQKWYFKIENSPKILEILHLTFMEYVEFRRIDRSEVPYSWMISEGLISESQEDIRFRKKVEHARNVIMERAARQKEAREEEEMIDIIN